MTWTQLLANNEVQRHKTSKKELDKLGAAIRRDYMGLNTTLNHHRAL